MSAPLPPVVPAPIAARRQGAALLVAGGLVQAWAVFAPAVRVRLVGTVPFLKLQTAGPLFVVLALLTIGAGFRAGRWWRWVPGVLAGALTAAVYWRVVTNPSGTFFDFALRHAVHPAWGFVPMAAGIALALAGALRAGERPGSRIASGD